jgi:small subunit ribosomal protein S20
LTPGNGLTISIGKWRRVIAAFVFRNLQPEAPRSRGAGILMANTTSARKATRVIARRTKINQSRLSRARSFIGKVEDAIATGDQAAAAAALKAAEPEIIRAAQKGVLHRATASRKVSRLTRQIAKLGK